MSEIWAKWQDQVINGVFPLRRLLGYSDHSGVFLTEFKARNLPDAALKLVPAAGNQADTQLAFWNEASALSHPHVIQLFEAGRCELAGTPFIFFVMHYAEQTLAQLLVQRALTPEEVTEMLRPTLAGLGFLHRRHRVQGALKPSNILVVGDQLKLASDTIRPFGDAADDVRSLGMTMIEALTQRPPEWVNELLDPQALPATLPESLAGMVRQCLNRSPADRPTVADLESQLRPVLPEPVQTDLELPEPVRQSPPAQAPLPQAPVPQATTPQGPPPQAPAPQASAPQASAPQVPAPQVPAPWPKPRLLLATFVLVALLSLIAWAALRSRHPPPPTVAAVMTAVDAVPAASEGSSAAADHTATPPVEDSRVVLHEEIPEVSRGTRGTIRGSIKVGIRVTVDSSGSVTRAVLEKPGTSKYFDRVATQAAGRWKFAPTDDQGPRQWLLRFEFTRSGTAAHAAGTPLSQALK